MKKMLAVFFVLLLCFFAFAEEDERIFFPSLKKSPVLPIDVDLGQCANSDNSEEHKMLSQALSEEYSFEWAEKYLHKEMKKNLVSVYSDLLSEILPSEQVLYSKAVINNDKSSVITVKFPEKDTIVSFAIKDEFIYAILD